MVNEIDEIKTQGSPIMNSMSPEPLYPQGGPVGSLPSDERSLLLLRVIGFTGLLAANLYGWSMVHAGFVNTRLLPENSFFGPYLVAFIMSGFVQAGIFGFYLSFPHQRHLTHPARFFLTALWLPLVVLGVVFSFYSITLSSDRANIVNWHRERIVRLNQGLQNVDQQISGAFVGHIGALNQSRIDACNGRDETGIARCGPISVSFLNRATILRNGYAPQLEPAIVSALPPQGAFESASRAAANADGLRPKVEAFVRFGRDAGIDTSATVRLYETTVVEITQVGSSYGNQAPDALSLVLARAFDNMWKMVTLHAAPDVYLAGMIAFLPDLLSLLFVLLLMVDRAARGGGNPHRLIKDAERQARSWGLLGRAWRKLFEKKMEAMGEKIKNDAADAVAGQPLNPGRT